jgi:hypothetical protein
VTCPQCLGKKNSYDVYRSNHAAVAGVQPIGIRLSGVLRVPKGPKTINAAVAG